MLAPKWASNIGPLHNPYREGEDGMAGSVESRLSELGITLPPVPSPLGNYVPYTIAGNLVFIAGQGAITEDGIKYAGRVGGDITLEDAQESARLCAVNLIAIVKAACGGDLERVVQCVKLGAFVHCGSDFKDHPKVINGASDLLVAVLGDRGRHARFAVGAPSLPFGLSVEIDGVFEIG